MTDVTIDEDFHRCLTFFELIFGTTEGYIAIGYKPRGLDDFKETFFRYPQDLSSMINYSLTTSNTGDIYYCTQILSERKRVKENVKICPNLWVDLDQCGPENLDLPPTITIESSPGRFQGLWVLREPLDPLKAEELSRRLTYNFAEYGSDKNGWCLTKYLRVPFTPNYKYHANSFSPIVRIYESSGNIYDASDFERYPQVDDLVQTVFPFPKELPGDADDVMMAKRDDIHPLVWTLFSKTPEEGKWSSALWKLETLLVESGLTREEIFVIVKESSCNKYARDNRPDIELWRDVCKAWVSKFAPSDEPQESLELEIISNDLLTEDEKLWVKATPSIVEDYIRWASELSDAAWQYHEAGIFIILSSLLCGCIRLPTSAAILNTNLWFMILANTTLTRKTTAMGIAMGVLDELDSEVLLATDGSPEGLLTALSGRPGRPSLFLRDEVSGLLDAMRKEYMAGLGEALAKLYDGNRERRQLRKEVIDIRDPRLVLFTGGVKNRVYELLDSSHVMSGFLPRFVFVTAEPIMKNLRPMGPPTTESLVKRAEIIRKLQAIRSHYADQTVTISVNGNVAGTQKKIWEASLTDEAWHRVNRYSEAMIDEAMKSVYRDMLVPTFDRLNKSGLKIATLLAACRNLGDKIVVEDQDIIRAFYYVERFRLYAIEVIENLGKNPFEKLIDKITQIAAREPGVTKSKIMRMCQLTARSAEEVLTTMAMRGLIKREPSGPQGKFERIFVAKE